MGGVPRQRGNQAQAERSQLLTLLPVLIILFFPLISSIISGLFSTPPVPDPVYSYEKTNRLSSLRYTTPHKIPYYVNQKQLSTHPIWESLSPEARENPQAGGLSPLLQSFERRIEQRFVDGHLDLCRIGEARKRNEVTQEEGLFGYGTDWEKVRRIKERPVESCQLLAKYGFIEG
jgi:DnaJ family protein B protein 12